MLRVSVGPRPRSILASRRLSSVTERCVQGLNCNSRPCLICGRASVSHRRVRVIKLQISRGNGPLGSEFRRQHDGRVAHRLRGGCGLRPTRQGRHTRHPRLGGISCTTKSIGRRVNGAIGTTYRNCHFRSFKRCGTLLTTCGIYTRRIGNRVGNGPCRNVICSTVGSGKRGTNGPMGTSHVNGSINCRTIRHEVRGSNRTVGGKGLGRHAQGVITATVRATHDHGRLRRRLGGRNVSIMFHRGSDKHVCNIAFVSRSDHIILGNSHLNGRCSTGIFGSLCSSREGTSVQRRRSARRRRPNFAPGASVIPNITSILNTFNNLLNNNTSNNSRPRSATHRGEGGGGGHAEHVSWLGGRCGRTAKE